MNSFPVSRPWGPGLEQAWVPPGPNISPRLIEESWTSHGPTQGSMPLPRVTQQRAGKEGAQLCLSPDSGLSLPLSPCLKHHTFFWEGLDGFPGAGPSRQ